MTARSRRTALLGAFMLSAIAFFVTLAPAANAQAACVVRENAVAQLEAGFAQRAVGRGLAPRGAAMVELFVAETGTWTVMVTDTAGRTCIVATGKDWIQIAPLLGDPA